MLPAKLLPPSTLPNSEGFRFLGFNAEGQKFRCEVVRDADGIHTVDGMNYSEMVGWTNEVLK